MESGLRRCDELRGLFVTGVLSSGPVQSNAINSDRPFDVLQGLLTNVLEIEVKAIAYVIANRPRNRYAACSGNALQARSHVDAIAKNIVALDNHIANVNADAELDAAIPRHVPISILYAALHFRGASYCVHHAGKFHQHPVAGEFDNSPLMLGDFAIDKIGLQGLQCCECAGLVSAHEAAVSDHVGGKNGT